MPQHRATSLVWRKSTRSSSTGNDCVEVADAADTMLVRDSKLGESSAVLQFRGLEWNLFVEFAKTR